MWMLVELKARFSWANFGVQTALAQHGQEALHDAVLLI